MKKKNLIQKMSSGKGFYITAAVSFCLVIAAIVLVYRTSTSMIKDILTTVPSQVTQEVQINKTDETDPRYTKEETTTEITTTLPSTTEEQETSMAWANRDESALQTKAETTLPVISNDSYALPLTGKIQKGFSPGVPVFDETMGDWRVHCGTDFEANEGAEVKSVGNGRVTKVVSDPNFGYIIEIDHGDFTARYCGLLQGSTVKANDEIEKGDTVGKLGTIPCEANQGSHLHFETVKNKKVIDPLNAMKLTTE